MCLLLETIKLERREFHNLSYHNARLNKSREELFGVTEPIDLDDELRMPEDLGAERFKCRVLYAKSIKKVEFQPYEPKLITSLKLVNGDALDYGHKYADRSALGELLLQKGLCNDILIVKDGKVTDSSYANVALYKNGIWYTPVSYLLPGTKRQQLIDSGRLHPVDIRLIDLSGYERLSLINAMLELDEISIPVTSIVE